MVNSGDWRLTAGPDTRMDDAFENWSESAGAMWDHKSQLKTHEEDTMGNEEAEPFPTFEAWLLTPEAEAAFENWCEPEDPNVP